MTTPDASHPVWRQRFAKVVVVATFLLIALGGMVTSTDSGLSVPDYPTTYDQNMFSFPLSDMVGGILYEHSHRLLASAVGLLTTILACWMAWTERRRWMIALGWVALLAVMIQGALGGLTVLYGLPAAVSVSHAGLAKLFLCMTIALAFFVSPRWLFRDRLGAFPQSSGETGTLRRIAVALTGLVYVQLILGAIMRHTYDETEGFAITDFPLSNGALLPEFTDGIVAVHFAHRLLGFAVAAGIFALAVYLAKHFRPVSFLRKPAYLLCFVVTAQITLGAFTIWTENLNASYFYAPVPWITTLHQANGALVLAILFMLTLRAFCRVEPGEESDLDALQI